MEDKFFKEGDLNDLFAELNNSEEVEICDKEMSASERRYMEIIKKHNKDKSGK